MIHHFPDFELDTGKRELRRGGVPVPVEPQVFALLQLLVENRQRLVSKDEIVARVWNGRIVSDAAISSRIKSARQAIGDDGRAQGLIKTVHKAGFRFLAEPGDEPLAEPCAERPSIAVLPFERIDGSDAHTAIAEALPHDLIVALSRLRWLFVIARASSFRFRGTPLEQVRKALNVRYCLAGTIEFRGRIMHVGVELSDGDGGVIWSERYSGAADDVHGIRETIVSAVVNALELQIPLHDAARHGGKPPANLDAWSAYHLGLHHMFRFRRDGNLAAARLFERAIALEPRFARAHAGLSFTHFENAFLAFEDRSAAAALARRHAEAGLEADPLDPFCNLVMGRVSWLDGDLEASLPWLDRAITLNPNYAQAKYSRAWTETLLGDGQRGAADTDAARQLSPYDPLLYGMLGVRALAHMVRDEHADAVAWAERAARAPRAHALIEMIAAAAHARNGDQAQARSWLRSARRRQRGLDGDMFLNAFPFRSGRIRAEIRSALAGLDND